jgi:hypothetical protein
VEQRLLSQFREQVRLQCEFLLRAADELRQELERTESEVCHILQRAMRVESALARGEEPHTLGAGELPLTARASTFDTTKIFLQSPKSVECCREYL